MVYGGIACSGALGDIHGLVRVCCLARNRHGARKTILTAGFRSVGLLATSRSYIERSIVGIPETVWWCPLPLMYLAAEHYRPISAKGGKSNV